MMYWMKGDNIRSIGIDRAEESIGIINLIYNIYPIVMIDGIVYKTTTVVVVLGIDKEGKKKVLGAWEVSTENSRVSVDLLQNLIERGLDISNIKLAVIDGSKALRKDLSEVVGKEILIQRCQIHKKKSFDNKSNRKSK